MSHSRHRGFGLVILIGLLVVAFFASTAFARIATSPLGLKQTTVFAGLGSCPLGSRSGGGPNVDQ
ncbi:MAG: hypothetical protein WBC63_08280 [Candidatus Bipolaricaulia bacterium]